MTERRRQVRVPASSGNLGPGYDVLGAALEIHLDLEVAETGEFSVEADGMEVPLDRENLVVRAFERLHSADGLSFRISGEIPLARGMGSSASAIVAGLFAADHMFELGNSREELFAIATGLEGHPDNVAAAIYGGIVVCAPPGILDRNGRAAAPIRLEPPQGVEGILVIPGEEVSTGDARAAIPDEVPIADATHNAAALGHLLAGIERSDLTLIERGLSDRLHQPHRRHLYERSMEIVEAARDLGALGATISGAGPSVLVWCYWQSGGEVAQSLGEVCGEWAEIRRAPFTPLGVSVEL